MNEVHVGDKVDFIEFGKYRHKGTVTEIKVLNTYDISNRPCVCVSESCACGHYFCFLRCDSGWKDLEDTDAELHPKYYEYLDMLFGITKDDMDK